MPTEVRLLVKRAEEIEEFVIDEAGLDAGVVVGRSEGVDLRIHHPGVGRKHCRIWRDDGQVFIEDLGSTNGTFFDGERLEASTPHELEDGVRFALGPVAVTTRLTDRLQEDATIPQAPAMVEVDPPLPIDDLGPDPNQPAGTLVQGSYSSFDAPPAPLPAGDRIDLVGEAMTFGRQDDCEIVLDNLLLSRRHARLRRRNGAWTINDLGSTNGTFVNGQQLRREYELERGDSVRVGPYEFTFEGDHLQATDMAKEGVAVTAAGLSKPVKDRETGVEIRLLDEVTFRIKPGEFIGLLGPSGCGKSTLMDALNGRRPAPQGQVFYNDDDLYRNFEAYKVGIGYVPQELIFHENLPLAAALKYASRIRLSKDVTNEEIEKNIDEVLEIVGLAERRNTTIKDLSGGQKKRVSLAIELLCKPTVLFLDEVTSGLDLGTEKEMMILFRQLADRGITVICITHFVDSLEMCDRLVCLMRGRLVFYGTPADLREHFEIDRIAGIYDVLKNESVADKSEAVRRSERKAEEHRDNFVRKYGDPADEIDATDIDLSAERRVSTVEKGGTGQQALDLDVFIQQTRVLTRRYVQLLSRDRLTTGILILLAPFIAMMLCILVMEMDPTVTDATGFTPLDVNEWMTTPEDGVIKDLRTTDGQASLENAITDSQNAFQDGAMAIQDFAHQQRILGFGAILTVLFLALFGSVQEVVKELKVYHHERFARLQIGPYMLSKVGPLLVVGAIQSVLVVLVITFGSEAVGSDIEVSKLGLLTILLLTSFAGTCLGLAISAAVPEKGGGGTTDAATLSVMIMNAVVIPQVLFAGALVDLTGLPQVLAQLGVTGFWSFEAFLDLVASAMTDKFPDTSLKSGDLVTIRDDAAESVGLFWAMLVVIIHALVFFACFGIALARKDGPEGFRNMLSKLPKDSKALLGQARGAVRKKNAAAS